MNTTQIKDMVRNRYAQVAQSGGCCCGCGGDAAQTAAKVSQSVGYSDDDIAVAPEGANLGLGCGNPVALASIREGDTVLDLGSGAGFDCFLAARKTGPRGRVIGVDMTPEMLARARDNAARGGYENVEFRQGEIEQLPVEDDAVDIIISNCVINLSPDKPQVFREAFRVLRPGGRLFVSDLVLLRPLPWWVRRSAALYAGCVAGAMLKQDYLAAIRAAGFSDIQILGESSYMLDFLEADPNLRRLVRWARQLLGRYAERIAASVVSVKISAQKT